MGILSYAVLKEDSKSVKFILEFLKNLNELISVLRRVDHPDTLHLVGDECYEGFYLEHLIKRETVLHAAVRRGSLTIFKTILDYLNETEKYEVLIVPDKEGNSVLHIAVNCGDIETVKLILGSLSFSKQKLVLQCRNNSKMTPFDLANKEGRTELSAYLNEVETSINKSFNTCPQEEDKETSYFSISTLIEEIVGQKQRMSEFFKFHGTIAQLKALCDEKERECQERDLIIADLKKQRDEVLADLQAKSKKLKQPATVNLGDSEKKVK